ncbi:hypothetical protein OpiT1DRAFT_00176 [Opitutaceae bacterium TAV1]|nr:hypothetical protein OpiT1DRAFT_00176 [Opitutaceae bacterium TAV1]
MTSAGTPIIAAMVDTMRVQNSTDAPSAAGASIAANTSAACACVPCDSITRSSRSTVRQLYSSRPPRTSWREEISRAAV